MGEKLYMERLVWFLNEMRNSRFPNATTLSAKFEISKKTAQRTIEYLRDRLHAPIEYRQSRRGYRLLDAAYNLPFVSLTESELTALLASRKLLNDAASGPIGEELGRVAAKLGALLEKRLPGADSPGQSFSFRWNGFSPSDPLIFRQIVHALVQRAPVAICYSSPSACACTMRIVEPHHMVNYMGDWHLIAFCRLRGDWRDFNISRISICKLENENFPPRSEEEWRPFLENTFGIFQNRRSYNVALRFSPERSRWIRGQIWHKDQTMEELDDGGLRLTIPVSHEAEILMEILKHGAQVEVEEPGWLRKKVMEEIRRMKKNYEVGHEMGEVGE